MKENIVQDYQEKEWHKSDDVIQLPKRGKNVRRYQDILKTQQSDIKMIQENSSNFKNQNNEKSKGCLKSRKAISEHHKESTPTPTPKTKQNISPETKQIKFSDTVTDVFTYIVQDKFKQPLQSKIIYQRLKTIQNKNKKQNYKERARIYNINMMLNSQYNKKIESQEECQII